MWSVERCTTRERGRGSGVRRRAFTLLELLVAVAIIVVATLVAAPAVSNIIASNNYAASVNLVTTTLGNARAEAIRTGRPTAVAFLFDVETQRMSLQVLELASDQAASLSGEAVGGAWDEFSYARAFVPALGSAPVLLPRGVAVFGLSYAVSPESGDGSTLDGSSDTPHWYAGEIVDEGDANESIPWLFPRNDVRLFADGSFESLWSGDAADAAVRSANTFMIQFSATGSVESVTSAGGVTTPNAYLELRDAPLLTNGTDPDPVDDAFAFDPEVGLDARIEPNPEVLLRSASRLAIVDLNRLTRELGPVLTEANIDVRDGGVWDLRSSGSLAPESSRTELSDDAVRDVSRWIDLNAEQVGFNRYTGTVLRRESPR
jgi:prepilin-type N-terminal cleavage/methylation domain-containing protein